MDRLLPWLRRSGWAYVAAAVVLALVAWRSGLAPGQGAAPQPTPAEAAPVEVRRTPAPALLVHVAGEVRRPGVYRLPRGARVAEALRRAGGPRRRADLAAVNLAATVEDGQQVLILPRAPVAPAAAAASAGAPGAAGAPISLSSAPAAELETLDGIGPALAQRIVDWRTEHGGFTSVDELLDVPGIGPARLEAMRDRVRP